MASYPNKTNAVQHTAIFPPANQAARIENVQALHSTSDGRIPAAKADDKISGRDEEDCERWDGME